MGQVLHGSATTTEAIRRAIQHSQACPRALAKRYGINQKTVAKWKKRTSSADQRTGPKDPRSTVLSPEDGDRQEFRVGWPVEHQAAMARVKRSPKMTANCALAMTHSRGPIFHAFSERFKTG